MSKLLIKKTIVPWWLSGGISAANCVAAYQAKGAADYAASKVNLANPGTYNLTATSDPSFATATGWTFSGSEYLITGITPAADWSFIVQYEHTVTTTHGLFGSEGTVNTRFFILLTSTAIGYGAGGYQSKTPQQQSGNVCLSGSAGYRNGTSTDAITRSWSGTAQPMIIGGLNSAGTPGLLMTGKITSIAFYNAAITSDQVSAVYTAMNAL